MILTKVCVAPVSCWLMPNYVKLAASCFVSLAQAARATDCIYLAYIAVMYVFHGCGGFHPIHISVKQGCISSFCRALVVK